jgi:lipoprotein-anchoring transpeptidase ErfK/SrfK
MMVGNEFLTTQPHMKVEVTAPEAALPPQPLTVAVNSIRSDAILASVPVILEDIPHASPHHEPTHHLPFIDHVTDHIPSIPGRYRVATAALITLVFGAAIINLAGRYWAATHITSHTAVAAVKPAHQVAGLNIAVPAADLQSKLQSITTQSATLTVGTYSEQLNSDLIKGWLQVTANKDKSEYFIHVNEAAMAKSLTDEANQYARTPVNQVTVTEDGASVVAVAGKDGRSLSDPSSLKTQSQGAAKNVLAAGGLQFNTPLQTVPFQAVTPANFDKLLVADITTKKLWAYQNGQLVKTFLTSDGAPATPTPTGEYHIYAKYTSQDMSGYNTNGTKYFQPKVPWVNYFTGGNAIHGVYWHPLSWFGNINSSHGCVGIPVDQAQWVYNWAPVGTTVITHA